jgi:hypothetical protein
MTPAEEAGGMCYDCHRVDRQVEELTQLRAEVERLRAEIIPLLRTIVICGGYPEPEGSSRAGWYGAMALSHVRDAGDRLVELGVWERHPDGAGRMQWYRPIPSRK